MNNEMQNREENDGERPAPHQNPLLLRIDPTTFVGSLADVVFVVASKDDAGGHLVNVRRPPSPGGGQQPITDFTLEQLLNGDVFYVDKGLVAESQIGLRMSNKRSKTNGGVITLRIQTFRLEVIAVNNTGLTLAAGGSALITPHNLTFTTNVPGQQAVNIRSV